MVAERELGFIVPESTCVNPTLLSRLTLSPLFLGSTLTKEDAYLIFQGREASPETEVVLEAGEGNSAAQACVYVAYHDRVANYLFNKTGRKGIAEDLTSKAMEGVRKKISTFEFRQDASFFSWVFVIAYNCMATYYRLEKRRERYESEFTSISKLHKLQTATPKDALEDYVLRSVLYDSAVEKLPTLPQRQRQAVHLRFVADLSIARTAAEMNTTEGTVKKLQHKGVARLKKLMVEPPVIELSQTPLLGSDQKSA